MSEYNLNRGVVREYDSVRELGFVTDGETHMQLPFYFRDGRFLTPPYVEGIPSFTAEPVVIEQGKRLWLPEPRIDDELVYRVIGRVSLMRITRWTYASYLDQQRLYPQKPSENL